MSLGLPTAPAYGADCVPTPEDNRAIRCKSQNTRELRPNGGGRGESHFAPHPIKLTTQRHRIATPFRFVGRLRNVSALVPAEGDPEVQLRWKESQFRPPARGRSDSRCRVREPA
jgi:hypothetical protein